MQGLCLLVLITTLLNGMISELDIGRSHKLVKCFSPVLPGANLLTNIP
jgi:hypothetical protein